MARLIKKILIALLFLMLPGICFASWTISANITRGADYNDGTKLHEIVISATSDGSDPAEFNLSTYLTSAQMDRIKGGFFYQVVTDPGTEPDDTYTLAFDNDLGGNILDLSGLSVTATEIHDAAADLGFFPIIFDLQIDIGDIGSASDSITIYIDIIK